MKHPNHHEKELTNRRAFLKQGLALAAMATVPKIGTAQTATMSEDVLGNPAGPDDSAYWSRVRAMFPIDPNITYLNTGTLGVLPIPVADAVGQGYRRYTERGELANEGGWDRNDRLRERLARLIGADEREVAFTRNAMEALDAMIHGIRLEPGDEVLMTSHEYPSCDNLWDTRARRSGIRIRRISIPSPPDSPEQVVDLFRQAITSKTRALFFCHITRGPGMLYPAKALCALAREHGLISAIDGAQAVGMIPVDVHDIGCDLYANSLHKWALGPTGTGLLYARQSYHDLFWPRSGGVGPWHKEDAGLRQVEWVGTYAVPVRSALSVSLDLIDQIGMHNITARDRYLSNRLKSGLHEHPGIRLITSDSPELSSPGITSFQIKGWRSGNLSWIFKEKFNMNTGRSARDDFDVIRISTHLYNTEDDVHRVLGALTYLRERDV